MRQLQTARLRGEPLGAEHLPELHRMHSDERVMRTLGGLRAPDWTQWLIDETERQWRDDGFGLWHLRERQSGRFAGRGGLRRVRVDHADEVELAYALMPECWGRGLATELARAALLLGFEELNLDSVVAFTLPENLASRRVLEKSGFTEESDIEHRGLPHVLYRRNRD